MEDLTFSVIDCENISITTPNLNAGLNFITQMQESPATNASNIQKYTIEFGKNCCPSETIDIPVFYDFSSSFATCSFNNQTQVYNYGFNILNINPLFVRSIRTSKINTLNYVGQAFTNVTGNTGIRVNMTYAQADVTIPNAQVGDPLNTQDYTFFVEITHTSGFIYVVEMTFRLTQPGGCTMTSSSIVSIVYPEIDERVVFTDLYTLNLAPLYQVEGLFYSGVYEVIICKWSLTNPLTISSLISECVQNNLFLDCNLKCEIVNKLVQCKDTNIMTYYRALQFANDCNTSYQDMCDIYEIMMNKLNNPDCQDPYDDCNCGDSKDRFFTQRSYNNNKTVAKSCGSCK